MFLSKPDIMRMKNGDLIISLLGVATLLLASSSFAQENIQYEYLTMVSASPYIYTCIGDSEFDEENVFEEYNAEGSTTRRLDAGPLIKRIKGFESDGWEIMRMDLNQLSYNQMHGPSFYVIMRKKKE